ncbi:MAG: DUF4760 domain-containing protein [Chloroflexota bacterium]
MAQPTQRDVDILLRIWDMSRSEHLVQARNWMFTQFHVKDFDEFKVKHPRGSPEWSMFHEVCSHLELCGVLINRGLLNEDLYFDLVGGIETLWHKAKKVIYGLREETDPRMYENFELLFERCMKWQEAHPPKKPKKA